MDSTRFLIIIAVSIVLLLILLAVLIRALRRSRARTTPQPMSVIAAPADEAQSPEIDENDEADEDPLPSDLDVTHLPYRKKDYVFSIAEKTFFGVLHDAVGEDMHVFPKMRLEELFWLPKGTENRYGYRARVRSRHVDFVLCDKQRIAPLAVIELDDTSHQRPDRQQRDAFVDAAFNTAGLPIIRYPARQSYDAAEVRAKILESIKSA